jgi:uncharacterized cofD-like protein
MDKKLKVCTIGGGSGMPIVNKALIRAGFENIKSIVTTFDSGGETGRMRTDERGKILAFSDYWRALISLWDDGKQKEIWQEMLRFRDGRGRNFGNIFFQFLAEKEGELSDVDSAFEALTGAKLKGSVVPVSTDSSHFCFKTVSNKKYCGEHNLDELRMSLDKIEDIWLEPKVRANKEAIEVIVNADLIIVCPGSMYGSILINFLPKGMIEAYKRSKAKKILMTNISSMANENSGFDQDGYVSVFEKYLNCKSPFDLILMADLSYLPKKLLRNVLKLYALEHSFPIKFSKKSKIKTIKADVVKIEEKNMRLRHSEKKLGEIFRTLEL